MVDNKALLQDSAFAHHRLYTLKGADRLWPHRVNSLQRFRYLYPEWAGFECDIRFLPQKNVLTIDHDSTGPNQLTEYLDVDSTRRKLFWLDLKNIDASNITAFCSLLQHLEQNYAIRDRVILECYDTLAATALHNLGYLTALSLSWLDTGRIPALRRLCPQTINFLSVESQGHSAALRDFPGRKQINWDIAFGDGIDRNNLLRQANDTDLLVCLINVKSPGYR